MTVLKTRFQNLGRNGLESKIAKQTDPDVLSQWLVNASSALNLSEFRKKTNL